MFYILQSSDKRKVPSKHTKIKLNELYDQPEYDINPTLNHLTSHEQLLFRELKSGWSQVP